VFGACGYGQLGLPYRDGRSEVQMLEPVELTSEEAVPPELLSAVHVSAGARHVCVVTERGTLYTWGDNEFGQLGRSGRAYVSERASERLHGSRSNRSNQSNDHCMIEWLPYTVVYRNK